MRRAALALLLVLSVVAPAAAPAAASPAPTWVCPACTDPLERSAESRGVSLSVVESAATARVGENGTVAWTATVRVADAESLRALESRGALRETVADAFATGGPETRLRTVSVDGDRLRLRYVRPGTVERSMGVLRFDGLRDEPGTYVYMGLGADRVTVVGPEGSTVAWAPASATVDGERVALTELPGRYGPFLAFAPAGTTFSRARGLLAVAAPVAPDLARNALLLFGFPLALLGACALGGRRLAAVLVGSRDPTALALAVAGLGVAAAAHPLYLGVEPLLGSANPPLFAGGIATALLGGAVARSGFRERASFGLAVAAAAVAGVLGVSSLLALGPTARYLVVDARTLVGTGLALSPALAMFVAGYAPDRRGVAVVLAAGAAGLASVVDPSLLGSYLFSSSVLVAAFYALAAFVGGLPLLVLGRTLAAGQ